jgi:hypothetical protein
MTFFFHGSSLREQATGIRLLEEAPHSMDCPPVSSSLNLLHLFSLLQ